MVFFWQKTADYYHKLSDEALKKECDLYKITASITSDTWFPDAHHEMRQLVQGKPLYTQDFNRELAIKKLLEKDRASDSRRSLLLSILAIIISAISAIVSLL